MDTSVLIVHTDMRVRRTLRDLLEIEGYVVLEATSPESALTLLRESEGGIVVLFDVSLFDNTMTGADSVAILGAATHDKRLADKRAFVVITPTPENVEVVFGRMLGRIQAPIVAEPVDPECLRHVVAGAARHLLVTA
jgi:CheY-like chemotaxis protein